MFGLENANEGSPVRRDLALWCFLDFAKLDEGDRKGLTFPFPSSFTTTNFLEDGDFGIVLVGFGEFVALNEISL
jgi:hypothetical protein